MAVYFLDEKLNRLGKIGSFLTVVGSIIIIIHSPKDSDINSLAEFVHRLLAPGKKKYIIIECSRFLAFLLFSFVSRVHIFLGRYNIRSSLANRLVRSTIR